VLDAAGGRGNDEARIGRTIGRGESGRTSNGGPGEPDRGVERWALDG